VKAEEKLLILIGSELRGKDLKALIDFGLTIPGAKFALISDYANSRGAADMGLLPDLLPGYTPLAGDTAFAEYNRPTEPGLDMLEMFEAAGRGELSPRSTLSARIPSPATASTRNRSRIPSSLYRNCFLTRDRPDRRRHPSRRQFSTKNPGRWPTAMAISNSSVRPETAPASAPTSR